jgi:DNA-binding transcriptional LysR family regulator
VTRLGGYSSVVRSVLMPALAPLLRTNPNIRHNFQNAEMGQLPELLLTGQVDFIVMDTEIHRADIETARLARRSTWWSTAATFSGRAARRTWTTTPTIR